MDHIKLAECTKPINYKLTFEKNGKVIAHYIEFETDESFSNIGKYILALSQFYRNRIDVEEIGSDKSMLCLEFINRLYQIQIDWRSTTSVKKYPDLDNDIKRQIDYITFLESSFIQGKNFETKEKDKSILTLNQKILILEYIGFIDNIQETASKNMYRDKLVSTILFHNQDSVRKAIDGLIGKPSEYGTIKNRNNLTAVYDFLDKNNFSEFAIKVKSDINKIE